MVIGLGCGGRTVVRKESQTVVQPSRTIEERTTVETIAPPAERTTVIKRKRTTEIE